MPFAFQARRRQLLRAGTATLAAATAGVSWAQPKSAARGAPVTVAQLFDSSAAQQDVSKDFLIGSRAAWQEINARGGVRGRPVQHVNIDVDGTPESIRNALATVRDNASCVCLSGTSGDPVATKTVAMLRESGLAIAHAAPWLQNSTPGIDDHTFPIFAARQEQIAHALRSLSVMGVAELGAVYATQSDHALYHVDMERTASALKLKLQSFHGDADLTRLGQRLTQSTPAILLFVGGTPELVQFTQGLDKQSRQRYVIALADVNLQTMMQMGGSRNTPVIATQAVPMVNASLPVVRSYRETLGRLFDEPPTALSLAGFIAARYTCEVLSDVEGPLTRASALAAFQKRASLDIGGFRVVFNGERRSATYVTQSMLTLDGRVVG